MVKVIHAVQDGELAARIEHDVQTAGLGEQVASIVILSPDMTDIHDAIINALDSGQRIILVLAAPTPLPKMIAHLVPVDFTEGYDFEALRARLSEGGTPMKVVTPALRQANRRVGYVVWALVIMWFLIALIFIGGGVIRRPDEEYNAVETQIILTRNYYVDANLPHTTQEAAEFASTVQAVPTALRPILSATATALAAE
jgi:hypothetical protein